MQEIKEMKGVLDEMVLILSSGKPMETDDVLSVLREMLQIYEYLYEQKDEELQNFACKHALKYVLAVCKRLLMNKKVVDNEEWLSSTYNLYRQTFAFVSRRSLAHFIEFMEWERTSHNQVFNNRRDTLAPIVYYLNKMVFDKKLKYFIFSLAPSMGKTFVMNYFSAWNFGLSVDSSILRLSYGEDLVLASSRSVKDIISSPLFAEVFPDYKRFDGKPFEKEKESDWKIKGSDTLTSHISRTRDGAVTGVRANKFIIFDDMTKGREEATNDNLHEMLYSKWNTEWQNRRASLDVGYIFGGTMWSPNDILNKVTQERENISPLIPSKKYKFVWESEDGSTVVIRVPLLDENDVSTCKSVIPTEEALRMRDKTDEYEWACVYQQEPIAPSGLEFASGNLLRFDVNEVKLENYAKAVLDPARKGKDFVSMPIFSVDLSDEQLHSCMIDVLFKQKPMTELYDEIVDRIILNNVILLVVENNTDTSLSYVIENKLRDKGYHNCEIREKYATKNKEQRIKDARGVILRRCRFKKVQNYTKKSDYGQFMTNLERYSFDYPNKHDDAPDSLAMFVNEIVLDKYAKNNARAVDRSRIGI